MSLFTLRAMKLLTSDINSFIATKNENKRAILLKQHNRVQDETDTDTVTDRVAKSNNGSCVHVTLQKRLQKQ